ncbi:hypothetical protein N7517_010488 [Penicillium concentricum]|uniref:Uncharacterized protein n=1 Tax=Penicillium concentricum TaxID=293559 RepID=A0A9W9RBM9_9EURO|nr:uncharacterized protein N7517_010488 [Penicillium concentricum]KAJ5355879.1 hypothetical protein N7517_010488 [Penicillium concentricum]
MNIKNILSPPGTKSPCQVTEGILNIWRRHRRNARGIVVLHCTKPSVWNHTMVVYTPEVLLKDPNVAVAYPSRFGNWVFLGYSD